jgi:hypothetical protein
VTDELETTLDQLETKVLETLENPYSTYLVQFPYTCSELDQEHGKSTYAKHLIKWTRDRMHTIDPREVEVLYGDNPTIELMTNEQIEEFREGCLNDE